MKTRILGGLNLEREEGGLNKNVQIETQSHSSVLRSAHMTATSKYTICSPQWDEERNEAGMKNSVTAA